MASVAGRSLKIEPALMPTEIYQSDEMRLVSEVAFLSEALAVQPFPNSDHMTHSVI